MIKKRNNWKVGDIVSSKDPESSEDFGIVLSNSTTPNYLIIQSFQDLKYLLHENNLKFMDNKEYKKIKLEEIK